MYYTVYLNKTEEIIAFGHAPQCAAMLGTSVDCFHSMLNRVRNGRNKKYAVVTEEIDDGK